MLRCLLICPGQDPADEPGARDLDRLGEALDRIPDLEVARTFRKYPAGEDLLRSIRLQEARLVILPLSDPERARDLARHLDEAIPGFAIIAVGGDTRAEAVADLMRLGVREYIPSPVDPHRVEEAVAACRRRLATHPVSTLRQGDLYSFLPAKPGVGASTIALQTSSLVARNSEFRTLLMDADLQAGVVRFQLKLDASASLIDALRDSGKLDEDLWSRMVGSWKNLEVLHAGRLLPPPSIDVSGVPRILSVARSQYELICADLPGSLDELSVALMRESRRIFLVTTPEVKPLYMAAVRVRHLADLGLDTKVILLLNRAGSTKLTLDEVAEAVGLPVGCWFPNDFGAVRNAVLDTALISPRCALGKSLLDFAGAMVPCEEAPQPSRRPRFLEFFHLAHTNDLDAA